METGGEEDGDGDGDVSRGSGGPRGVGGGKKTYISKKTQKQSSFFMLEFVEKKKARRSIDDAPVRRKRSRVPWLASPVLLCDQRPPLAACPIRRVHSRRVEPESASSSCPVSSALSDVKSERNSRLAPLLLLLLAKQRHSHLLKNRTEVPVPAWYEYTRTWKLNY